MNIESSSFPTYRLFVVLGTFWAGLSSKVTWFSRICNNCISSQTFSFSTSTSHLIRALRRQQEYYLRARQEGQSVSFSKIEHQEPRSFMTFMIMHGIHTSASSAVYIVLCAALIVVRFDRKGFHNGTTINNCYYLSNQRIKFML